MPGARARTGRPGLAPLVAPLLIASLLAGSLRASNDIVDIMPLGDSITASSTGHASYRYWLWKDLQALGVPVNFEGSQVGVFGGGGLYSDFDKHHEGHWGWTADNILAAIPGWAAPHRAEVVLLHIGHNDLGLGQDVDSVLDEIEQIIDALRAAKSTVTVVVAKNIPSTNAVLTAVLPAFHAALELRVAAWDQPWSRVLVADPATGFDPVADTWDGVHPDESGEKKIAAAFLAVLQPILEGKLAAQSTYGAGWPDPGSAASLTLDAPPLLGTVPKLAIAPGLGAGNTGLLAVGLQPAAYPLPGGGQLLVDPFLMLALPLPPGGLMLNAIIPADPTLVGVEAFLQVIELDAVGSAVVSASPGLEIHLGDL